MRLFANISIDVTEPPNHKTSQNDIVQVSIALYNICVSEHWIIQETFVLLWKWLKAAIRLSLINLTQFKSETAHGYFQKCHKRNISKALRY